MRGFSSCLVFAGLLSSVLGSLQPPAITSVPLRPVVWQSGLGSMPDQGKLPVPAEDLNPVLFPAQVVVVDPSVGLEGCGPTVD